MCDNGAYVTLGTSPYPRTNHRLQGDGTTVCGLPCPHPRDAIDRLPRCRPCEKGWRVNARDKPENESVQCQACGSFNTGCNDIEGYWCADCGASDADS